MKVKRDKELIQVLKPTIISGLYKTYYLYVNPNMKYQLNLKFVFID